MKKILFLVCVFYNMNAFAQKRTPHKTSNYDIVKYQTNLGYEQGLKMRKDSLTAYFGGLKKSYIYKGFSEDNWSKISKQDYIKRFDINVYNKTMVFNNIEPISIMVQTKIIEPDCVCEVVRTEYTYVGVYKNPKVIPVLDNLKKKDEIKIVKKVKSIQTQQEEVEVELVPEQEIQILVYDSVKKDSNLNDTLVYNLDVNFSAASLPRFDKATKKWVSIPNGYTRKSGDDGPKIK